MYGVRSMSLWTMFRPTREKRIVCRTVEAVTNFRIPRTWYCWDDEMDVSSSATVRDENVPLNNQEGR